MALDQLAELDDPTASAVFRVGDVIGVEGRRIRIRVDKSKNGSHLLFKGSTLKSTAVGGYIKIAKGFSEIIAQIDGESVSESRDPGFYASKRDHVDRVLNVSAIGFIDEKGSFQLGVSEMPLINNECFLLTHEEFHAVHDFVGKDVALEIGTLPSEYDQPVAVGVDALFASHIGVFGNTGSGKSYTLSVLYNALLNKYAETTEFAEKARIVIIDFNGEYVDRKKGATSSAVIVKDKKSYELRTRQSYSDTSIEDANKLPLSEETLSEPEFWIVLLDATEKTQAPLIKRALRKDGRLAQALAVEGGIATELTMLMKSVVLTGRNVEDKANLDLFFHDISDALTDETRGRFDEFRLRIQSNLQFHGGGGQSTFYYLVGNKAHYADGKKHPETFPNLFKELHDMPLDFGTAGTLNQLRLKILFQYYADVFRGNANPEHVGPLLARLKHRFPEIEDVLRVSTEPLLPSTLTVISLRDVSLEMKKMLPLLFSKHLYDAQKAARDDDAYLNIVVDEAHTILSKASSRESETWKDYRLETFEEIIKEGRKFNVFLTIASQRPHDISDTIISQLHNYFLHRLVNELDIRAMQSSVSYLNKISFESLPILPTGHCILSGLAAQVPVVVQIADLPRENEPNNKTPRFTKRWPLKAS